MDEKAFLSRLNRDFPKLVATTDGGKVEVLARDITVVTIEQDEEAWILSNAQGHAHRETLGEALDTAWKLISNEARMVREFREERLSATWIEIHDGDSYEIWDMAVFLTPYDPTEWVLMEGESWRVERFEWVANDGSVELRQFEMTYEESLASDPELWEWLPNKLGKPPEDMRWTTTLYASMAVLVPIDWRRQEYDPESPETADFVSPNGDLMLRARSYFRDAEDSSGRELVIEPSAAVESTYEFEEIEGWHCDRYFLVFQDRDEDMLGVIEAFWDPELIEDPVIFRNRIQSAVGLTRMMPANWPSACDTEE